MYRILFSLSLVLCFLFSAACGESGSDEPASTDVGENKSDTSADKPDTSTPPPVDNAGLEELQAHCEAEVGIPRVEKLAPGLYVAMGYDLANTILLQTDAGNVVIDVSMSPKKAQTVKDALMEVAPGPTAVIIYTHSHADHVGGASVWVEEGTEIWATDAFMPHLMKQYGAFRGAEIRRVQLQHGHTLSTEELPCTAVGVPVDLEAALNTGVRKPTQTFSGMAEIEVGGVPIQLVEAHGETHDQLFVWLPTLEALMPGDNYYAAFPNLYTVRGTRPRPVDRWVNSLDEMRRRDPAILVPSHTNPVMGREKIRTVLRDYRDAIQWVYDEVVRGANQVEDLDAMAARIALPPHLTEQPYLQEIYGQVDWSVRAVYTNELGWFDARADRLYPPKDMESREIKLMGGADNVMDNAISARESGDYRWSAHLLGKLRDSGLADVSTVKEQLALTYHALGSQLANSNGRGYLLQLAKNLEEGTPVLPAPKIDEEFVDEIPIDLLLRLLPPRLKVAENMDVHESLAFEFTDIQKNYVITIRNGIAEVIEGEALPGTPEPVSVVTTDTKTWRRLVFKMIEQVSAVLDGSLKATNILAVATFMDRFEQDL